MDNFFKALGDKTKELKKAVDNAGKPKPNFAGGSGGQSLGGTKPGEVLTMIMEEPGPLGIKVEKSPSGSGAAIVSDVVAHSPASRADLRRGDIVCVPETQGQSEMRYGDFLQQVKSSHRPLVFDVRRLSSGRDSASTTSADALARRRAVVAAAEARDKAHKRKTKPVARKTLTTLQNEQTNAGEALTEESQWAVQQAKAGEAQLAQELGYNPYQVTKLNSGQAKTAAVTSTHGSVGGDAPPAPGPARAPSPPLCAAEPPPDEVPPVSDAFEEAWTTLVTAGTPPETLQTSLQILAKLVGNATRKFQEEKYRRVKLSNAKIQAAIAKVTGALEVLLACGFVLQDGEEGETLLVYPLPDEKDDDEPPPSSLGPAWLPRALHQMENYNATTTSL